MDCSTINHRLLGVCKEFVCPYASCSNYCIMLCWSWLLLLVVLLVVVVVEYCCCIPYRLALMLVLTFAPIVLTFAPCALTFASCTCGVIILSTSASTPLAHMVVVTGCNLRWCRVFFHPLVHILHLHSSNLHCVVVVCGGGSCMWMWRWWL